MNEAAVKLKARFSCSLAHILSLDTVADAVPSIGTAVGGWIGGHVGDRAALWSPHHGRILICQLSVFAGVPLSLIILKVDFVVAACRQQWQAASLCM